ncbi:MAG: choice-of-anchor D domain-containing protein, partial [Terracidiphilus sp.]
MKALRAVGAAALAACLLAALPLAAQSTNFGSINVGSSSASPKAITLTLDTAGTVGSIAVLTQGAAKLDFTDAGGGSCAANTAYNAGDTCTVNVTFKPKHPGPRYGGVELLDGSGNLLAMAYVWGTGVGPQATFADTTSGDYLPSAQSILGSGFTYPNGVAVDGSGNVFVADSDEYAVYEIVAAGGYVTVNTLGSGFFFPTGVAVDGSGNVFVADTSNSAVKEIVAAGGYTTVKTLGGGFWSPQGVAVDGSGNVFVGDTYNDAVKEIPAGCIAGANNSTCVLTLVGGFNWPEGVAVDASGNVFVADTYNNAVKEIVAAGGYTTVKTLGSGISHPPGVAVDGSGNVFVADTFHFAVKEIVAAGGYVTVNTLVSEEFFWFPEGVAVDGSGNVFVSNPLSPNDAVYKLDYADPPSLSFAATLAGQTSSDSPQTVTVSNDGNANLAFSALSSYPKDFPEANGVDTDCTASSVVAEGTGCTLSIDFTPQLSSLIGGSTALNESLNLTTDSLNATTAQSLGVSGTVTATALTSPTPGTVLTGPTVTFTWTTSLAPGATGYAFRLGTSVGANNVYASGEITATSATPTNLPTNGETIYARLYTYYGS